MKNRNFKKLSRATKQPRLVLTGKVPCGGGGGGAWGYLELGPGTPAMGQGVHIQEKSSSGPRSKYTHNGYNTQRSFDPHPTPKKGYPGAGGGGGGRGSKSKKNNWGIIFGPKMMILQGVRRQKPYIGVCYTNDPKKGGYMTLAPVLGLTTSLRGDLGPQLLAAEGARENS